MKIVSRLLGFYFNTLSIIAPFKSAKQAFYLFCFPFKTKLKPKQQEFLNTSKKFTLKVETDDVQYYQWGKGQEKIVFVHGWQSHSYRWKSFIEQFDKDKFTLLAFDAPGHGNSESKIGNVPLYEKSIESLIERVGDIDHFIGHSIGSFACASFIYHADYTVKSFTSLATPYSAHEFFEHYNNQLKMSKRTRGKLEDYFKQYTGYPVSHYSFETFTQKLNPDRALIIHDKNDASTSHKNSQLISELLQKKNVPTELIITEGLKHNLRSEKIVTTVKAFVDKQLEEKQLNIVYTNS